MAISYMTKFAIYHFIKDCTQYNSVLAIAGAIRRTSREKLYQELDIKFLQKRRWHRKLYHFFKINLKYLKVSLQIIFPKYIPLLKVNITQEIVITFSISIPKTTFQQIFFRSALLDGMIWALMQGVLRVMPPFRKVFWGL